MDDNKEIQETVESENVEPIISKEIGDFNFLITTLIDYYQAKAGMRGELDEGDEWKAGTKYERIVIPDKLDNAVEKAFSMQLKKFY